MPIGKASYGQLGNWGKKGKKISRKKFLAVTVLISLAVMFSISKEPNLPFLVNAVPDYNTSYGHTRTPIFADTGMAGSTQGSAVELNFSAIGGGSEGNSITGTNQLGGMCFKITTSATPLSATFAIRQDNTQTGSMKAEVFTTTITTSPFQCHVSATNGANPIAVSNSINTNVLTGSFANVTFTFSGSLPTLNSGSYYTVGVLFTLGSCTPVCIGIQQTSSVQDKMNDMVGNPPSLGMDGFPCTLGNTCTGFDFKGSIVTQAPLSKIQWNFNSTCVISPGGEFDFTFKTGIAGKGGNNCNSADILISKAPVNLQTVAGRMLEIVMGLKPNATSPTQLSAVDFVLRTNGTLPSFTENYDPFNDTQARMIWSICGIGFQVIAPVYLPCSILPSTAGKQGVWLARDQSKTISQETLPNDQIINGSALWPTTSVEEQLVLNFTGPNNYINSAFVSNTSNSTKGNTSNLQLGQDFYVMVKAVFGVGFSGTPDSTNQIAFINAQFGNIPQAFQMFSVPSSCSDQVNKSACSLPTAQPVFQFNPLDPSTWGNAVIKGFLWVFTVGVPQGLTIMAAVLIVAIRAAGNFIGSFLGQGNLGDNIANVLTGIGSLILQSGTVIGWLSNIITSPITMISILINFVSSYFPGLTNLLNDVSHGAPLIVLLPAQIAIWFPTSYMVVMIFFYFLLVMANGTRGFFEWIHLVKWSSFHLWNVFMRFLKGIVDGITWILGRISIISPGHKLTAFPHFEPGPLPHLDLHVNDLAIFHDPLAWFFSVVGFVFVGLFAGTSASGLPASSVASIANLQSLFLSLFGMIFMMLLLYIPSWLIMKLQEGAYKK